MNKAREHFAGLVSIALLEWRRLFFVFALAFVVVSIAFPSFAFPVVFVAVPTALIALAFFAIVNDFANEAFDFVQFTLQSSYFTAQTPHFVLPASSVLAVRSIRSIGSRLWTAVLSFTIAVFLNDALGLLGDVICFIVQTGRLEILGRHAQMVYAAFQVVAALARSFVFAIGSAVAVTAVMLHDFLDLVSDLAVMFFDLLQDVLEFLDLAFVAFRNFLEPCVRGLGLFFQFALLGLEPFDFLTNFGMHVVLMISVLVIAPIVIAARSVN